MQPDLPRLSRIVLAAFWVGMAAGRPWPVHAEPSLANLLGGRATQRDPTQELAQRLYALEQRAFATEAAVQDTLVQARAALAQLRQAYASAASDAVVQRRTGLVWAALSAADRVQARIAAAAALVELSQRARDAEAAAEHAHTALTQAQQRTAESAP